MKYLIVAADDFGLTRSVNEGIAKAREEGIVTSFGLLASGEAFEDAVRIAKEIGLEEAGAHLSLTETTPVTDPDKIRTLIAEEGGFHRSHAQFFVKLLLKKIEPAHIYAELKGQLERLEKTGIRLTNLSSHEHIHMLPEIFRIFVRLAKEHQIPCIRYPVEYKLSRPLSLKKIYKSIIFSLLDLGANKPLKESGLIHADNFLGFLDSGNIAEDLIADMCDSLPDGTTELVCHPGFSGPEVLERYRFHINCERELSALTSRRVRERIKSNGITLITYRDLISKGAR